MPDGSRKQALDVLLSEAVLRALPMLPESQAPGLALERALNAKGGYHQRAAMA